MIKLLVVDDESTTRKGLIKHVTWRDLGISSVEEAVDGIDAIEKAKSFCPNIVLSDIRMPGMNGVELANKLRETFPDCKIIFLSGYSDKEYLKAAINLNAVSYVEKPINISEVTEALKKAVLMCIEGEKKKLEEENINLVLSEKLPFIKQKIVTNLINSACDFETILNELSIINIPFHVNDKFYAMVLKLHSNSAKFMNENEEYYDKILDIVDEVLVDTKHLASYVDRDHIIVILHYEKEYEKEAEINFQQIKETLYENQILDLSIFCSIGKNVQGIDQIYESYDTAKITLKKLFFYGYNKFVFYKNEVEERYFSDESSNNQFSKYLSEKNSEAAISIIEKLCREIIKHDNTHVNHIKNTFFKLAFQLFIEAEKRGVYFSEAGDNEEKYLWDVISKFETLEEIREYMINKITTVFKRIEELESSCRTVYQVKKLIEKNHGDENLSTKILADQVYLTPAYLSALFKKETGKTISEYIIEIRIERSKEYLKDHKIKLFEVAKRVGYSDSNYYAKVFKKLSGLTPSEYREKYM